MKGRVGSAVRFGIAGTVGLALFLAISADAQTRRFERHFTVQGKPVVTVQNATGRIQVRAWDKQEVMIVGQRGSTNVEVDTEQVGNRIEIATRVTSGSACLKWTVCCRTRIRPRVTSCRRTRIGASQNVWR